MLCGLEGVSMAFGEKQVLSRFDFPLPERGSVCLFGPSGCGKTTVLRLLAGLERPQEGRVVGMAGRKISLLFQENRLLPWCTVQENMLLAMSGDRERIGEARGMLEAVGLLAEAERLPGGLSGGMRRRVALARALAHGGDVLLLDEPLKELDAETALRMRTLIREHAEGRLLLLITHDAEEARALCETVLVCSGPPLRIEP